MEKENLEILTRKEVSKLLKVSYATLERWRKSNVLPACILGTRVRYRYSDVSHLLTPKKANNDGSNL